MTTVLPQSLRVGVWGLGRHALRNVIPAIRQSTDVRLVGVHTRNSARGDTAARENDCSFWREDEAMLTDPLVDAVYLATPIGLHYEQAARVLAAGKHLICEKSLTGSLRQSLGLVEMAEQKGLVLCEALMFLFHPRFRMLAAFVRDEMKSDVRSLDTEFLLPELDQPGYRTSAELGGGAFLDVACYPIALAVAVGGSDFSVACASEHRHAGAGVDEGGFCALTWSGGRMVAHLRWGYGCAYRNRASITGASHSLEVSTIYTKGGGERMGFSIFDQRGGLMEVRQSPPANSFCEMLSTVARAAGAADLRRELVTQVRNQANAMERIRARFDGP